MSPSGAAAGAMSTCQADGAKSRFPALTEVGVQPDRLPSSLIQEEVRIHCVNYATVEVPLAILGIITRLEI